MKDIAYLLCCGAHDCSPASSKLHLERYHQTLCAALSGRGAAAASEAPTLAALQSA